ncbi:MAG: hypothetical protein ACK40G_09350 [Cytophagaceae bacterium]
MKHRLIYLFCGIFITCILASCKHAVELERIYGPEYASAPNDFYVAGNSFHANPEVVNFKTGKVIFTASFTHRVSWTIEVKGLSSGAVKYIKGLSSSIGETNASWDGGSDNLIFFAKNEKCEAVLSFLGSSVTLSDTITIQQVKVYDGILIQDFDGKGIITERFWYSYSDNQKTNKDEISFPAPDKRDYNLTALISNELPAVQGKWYLNVRGKDYNENWYVGGCGLYTENSFLGSNIYALSSDPDEIYLNAFVSSNFPYQTAISFSLSEPDDNIQDIFNINMNIDWVGWKLLSIKLSSFSLSPNSKGDGKINIKRLQGLGLAPSPRAAGAECDINVDYIIFTKGSPLKP